MKDKKVIQLSLGRKTEHETMTAMDPPDLRAPFKVLVPTDFSETARGAIDYVLASFEGRITHLYLLHASKDKLPGAPMMSLVDILREKAERQMQHEIKYVASSPKGSAVQVIPLTRFDGYLHAIEEIAAAEDIDLVVLGSNGYTQPRLDAKEDDPNFVMHKIHRPMLLVPKLLN